MTNPSILVKRPVAFRVPRTDPATAGETLSTTEWRLFSDEAEAAKDAALKSTDYAQGPSLSAGNLTQDKRR